MARPATVGGRTPPERVKVKIEALFDYNDQTYGYRRLHAELLRGGERAGDELVRKLMRELGPVSCQPRPFTTTTTRGLEDPSTPDLARRDFTAEAPGAKLVGDITYINTWEGWLYLATVIDCFNKEVIGYAMADHMRTELVTDAVDMAARNHDLATDCIFHSDRGTYTSTEFATKIEQLGVRASLGRTEICFEVSSPRGISPPGTLRTVLDSLPSHGSHRRTGRSCAVFQ